MPFELSRGGVGQSLWCPAPCRPAQGCPPTLCCVPSAWVAGLLLVRSRAGAVGYSQSRGMCWSVRHADISSCPLCAPSCFCVGCSQVNPFPHLMCPSAHLGFCLVLLLAPCRRGLPHWVLAGATVGCSCRAGRGRKDGKSWQAGLGMGLGAGLAAPGGAVGAVALFLAAAASLAIEGSKSG